MWQISALILRIRYKLNLLDLSSLIKILACGAKDASLQILRK